MTSSLTIGEKTSETWSRVSLGEHVDILSGFAFDSKLFSGSEGVPLIRIRDVVRGRTETRYTGMYDSRFVVYPGDLLVGMDGDFNRALWSSEPALLNQRVCKVISNPETLDMRYLYHFLPGALLEIWHQTPFATVKHLSAKGIRAISIPLPSIKEQRRIAAILDKADELRAKRRRAIAHLDALAQSMFHSMSSDETWSLITLRDASLRFVGGRNLVGSGADIHPVNKVLKVSAVSSGDFDPEHTKPLPATYAPPSEHAVRAGDLIVTRASGTKDLIGVATLIKKVSDNTYLPDKLWRADISDNSLLVPTYFRFLTKSRGYREYVINASSGAAGVSNISQAKLLAFEFRRPPIELQQTFATRVAAVERLKETHRKHLAELDALFSSLQSRAFKGEL